MTRVSIDMSISLDGYVAGPEDGPEFPLGKRGGERVFAWFQGGEPVAEQPMFSPAGAVDRQVVDEMLGIDGAVLTGRRTYEIANGRGGSFPINAMPVFIVTHQPPPDADVPKGDSTITFVTDGVASAIEQAKAAAKDGVVGVSGACIAMQALDAGVVDEIRLHVVPVLLGDGVRLFDHLAESVELEPVEVREGPGATHLTYRVKRR